MIGALGPSNSELLLYPSYEDPPLRLVPPQKRVGHCPYLLVMVLLG